MKQEVIDLGTGRVSSLFGKLFLPTLVGMVSVSAVTAIDGIAAVNICIPLLFLRWCSNCG